MSAGGAAKSLQSPIVEGADMSPEDVLTWALTEGVHHVCQTNRFEIVDERASANLILTSPEQYLKFPLSTVLNPNSPSPKSEFDCTVLNLEFNDSIAKTEVLEATRQSLQDIGCTASTIDDIVQVTDELFTNAIYNAPVAFLDEVTRPGVERVGNRVTLERAGRAQLSIGQSADRIAVACTDPFGALNIPRYLKKIQKTVLCGPAQTMNFGTGGAGIGSFMILNACLSLYLGVSSQSQTTSVCVFPRKMSQRKRLEMGKSIHWFQIEGGKSNGTNDRS